MKNPPIRRLALLLVFLLPTLSLSAFTDADWVTLNTPYPWGPVTDPNGSVTAMALDYMGNLYIAGSFTTPGPFIAKWDGYGWSTLLSAPPSNVCALAVIGNVLYAAGDFTSAGGVPANCIAKYQSGRWSALGQGLSGTVYNWWMNRSWGPYASAIAVMGTDVYVAGMFTQAGGVAASYIAKWNGVTWTNLASGVGGSISEFPYQPHVDALTVSGTNLYVGGHFGWAGSVLNANGIAKWDGSRWSAVGSGGLDPYGGSSWPPFVSSLAVNGNDVYVAGSFTSIGNGIPAANVAKWNGSVWSGLGSGINSIWYNVLSTVGTNLYLGGSFTSAGGIAANHIAQWNGTTWSPLGSGLDGPVNCLLSDDAGHLFVGGDFTHAGTNSAGYIVQANVGSTFNPGQFEQPAYSPLTGFICTFRGTPGRTYRIQTRLSFDAAPWTTYTNFTYTAPVTWTNPPFATSMFYRTVSP